ncbi:MAG: hybrid sensor histidine kinase/response regulator [Gemmatimonadales bacterium]
MSLWTVLAAAIAGFLLGWLARRRSAAAGPTRTPAPPPMRRVVVDQGAANALNALNNRLAAISALGDLLQDTAPDAKTARAIATLQGEVRRAAEVTQHFFDLAELPVGAADSADVGAAVDGVLADRQHKLATLEVQVIRVVPDAPPLVACPPANLTEVLGRLLDFCLRRLRDTKPPRQLRLEVAATAPSVMITLADNGPTLSPEAEHELAMPFRTAAGSGSAEIDFALARALAQSAGGSVRLRPRGGGGMEVVVTLHKSIIGQAAAATTIPTLPKLRILVVDDDPTNRRVMTRLLEREGHLVVAVEHGLEAIERLGPRDAVFDAVVTDVQMPRLGGRALYEQLSIRRPDISRRIVFVTGDAAREETRRFLEECGQPAVLKPYVLGDLLGAIAAVTARR